MADNDKTPPAAPPAPATKAPSLDGLPQSIDETKALVAENVALKAENGELKAKCELLEEALSQFKSAIAGKKKTETDRAFAKTRIRAGRDIEPGQALTEDECKGLTEGVHFEMGRFA